MGYFSNLATEPAGCVRDHSYISPEKQLLFRLEELEDRLCELTQQKTGKRDEGEYFSEDNLRYVLPEHFLSASNVRKAIQLTIRDLRDRYGISVGDEAVPAEPAAEESCIVQISFLDLLAQQSQCMALCAA